MTATNRLFNDGWQFCLCDIGTGISSLEGKRWYDVELPHDWLVNDTANLYKTGEGWYRRNLDCTSGMLSGRVLLNFDGVYMNSTVYVNGREAGSWNLRLFRVRVRYHRLSPGGHQRNHGARSA